MTNDFGDEYVIDQDAPCEECGGKNWERSEARGEVACADCGLVKNDYEIDYGKDWRVFSDGEGTDGERTGMPQTNLLHDKGLTTDMGWQNKDYSGATISGDAAKRMNRLRRQHARTRVRNSTERNLVLALGELDRLAGNMGLPTTMREEAAFIYRKAVEKKLVRGRSIEGMVAAAIYTACRLGRNARTLDEIGTFSKTGRKEIGRTSRALVKELRLRVPPAMPNEYIPRFCTDLSLPVAVQSRAMKLLNDTEGHDALAGRGPTGIAAASIYLAGIMEDNRRTQREVADVAGVTEVTIRNRFKEICGVLGLNPDNPAESETSE
jgi:transcription initiation factor TFIIB